eukprot:s19_g10.t1
MPCEAMATPETWGVLELLRQAGNVHEAQLKLTEQRLQEVTNELEMLRGATGAGDSRGEPNSPKKAPRVPTSPPSAPPKLTLQVGDRGPNRLGSRVSFTDDVAEPESPDQSPRPRVDTANSLANSEAEKDEKEELQGTPLPLPGIVMEEGQRRASESGLTAVVPGGAAGAASNGTEISVSPGLPRQMSRMTGDTEMTRFREDVPPDLKLANAWRKKSSGTTSKVARIFDPAPEQSQPRKLVQSGAE